MNSKLKKRLFPVLILALLSAVSCNVPGGNVALSSGLTPTNEAPNMEHYLGTAQAEILAKMQHTQNAILTTVSAEVQENPNIPTETPAANLTPPALPAAFTTDLLNPKDIPHTYVKDTCTLLKNRWSAGKAEPGTVVMVIMYHSIVAGDESDVTLDNQISSGQNRQIGENIKSQGFEAIDMTQFIKFITENDYIPPRSVLLISDDRHHKSYFEDHFKPFYDAYGWKVVNAWISADGTTDDLWTGNAELEAAGYVDHQAHGVVHNINMTDASTDEYIRGELQGSIDRIQEHFHKTPKAIIWPGGNFGFKPIQIAEELGYQVGFTVNPRGPVMYDWVPLADETDPGRPSYLADGMHNPLFVIPRYWDTDVNNHIDTVRQIGKAANEYLMANRETEIAYYNIVCKPFTGPLGE